MKMKCKVNSRRLQIPLDMMEEIFNVKELYSDIIVESDPINKLIKIYPNVANTYEYTCIYKISESKIIEQKEKIIVPFKFESENELIEFIKSKSKNLFEGVKLEEIKDIKLNNKEG